MTSASSGVKATVNIYLRCSLHLLFLLLASALMRLTHFTLSFDLCLNGSNNQGVDLEVKQGADWLCVCVSFLFFFLF